MGVSAPVAAKANGLSTVVNTIAAPAEAFETLRESPTWGWALIVALVLMLLGTYILQPAQLHAGQASMQQAVNSSTLFANMTAAQKQRIIDNAGKPNPVSYAGVVLGFFIAVFCNTLVMLIGNAAGGGQADFKRLWCGSVNIAVPTLGIGTIVWGAIARMRGPDSFNSSIDLSRAMPSIGTFVSHGSPALITFLTGISIFTVWGLYLNATMLQRTAKTSPAVAYVFAGLVLILGALISAGMMAIAHGNGMV
jgi:hypothetical protein